MLGIATITLCFTCRHSYVIWLYMGIVSMSLKLWKSNSSLYIILRYSHWKCDDMEGLYWWYFFLSCNCIMDHISLFKLQHFIDTQKCCVSVENSGNDTGALDPHGLLAKVSLVVGKSNISFCCRWFLYHENIVCIHLDSFTPQPAWLPNGCQSQMTSRMYFMKILYT